MTVFSVLLRLLLLAPMVLWLTGCFPGGNSPADEEKDPHYLAGKNRRSSMDYEGAIAAFENALISNPKNAAAHLQLGFLYEGHRTNYATAIYHFEKHLELRPKSNVAESVKQHIFSCKLELARTVPFALVSRQVQEEMRKLYATNALLHEQIQLLKTQLVEKDISCSNRLAQAIQSAMLARAQMQAQSVASEPERRPTVRERTPAPVADRSSSPSAVTTPKTHIVRPGETLAGIAKKYNIRLSLLQALNPNVDARKLRAGQVLTLPSNR